MLPTCSRESSSGGVVALLRRPRWSWPRLEAARPSLRNTTHNNTTHKSTNHEITTNDTKNIDMLFDTTDYYNTSNKDIAYMTTYYTIL